MASVFMKILERIEIRFKLIIPPLSSPSHPLSLPSDQLDAVASSTYFLPPPFHQSHSHQLLHYKPPHQSSHHPCLQHFSLTSHSLSAADVAACPPSLCSA